MDVNVVVVIVLVTEVVQLPQLALVLWYPFHSNELTDSMDYWLCTVNFNLRLTRVKEEMSWLLGQWARTPEPPAGGGSGAAGPQKPGNIDEKKEGSFHIEETKVRR